MKTKVMEALGWESDRVSRSREGQWRGLRLRRLEVPGLKYPERRPS